MAIDSDKDFLRKIECQLDWIRTDGRTGHHPIPWSGDNGDGLNDANGESLIWNGDLGDDKAMFGDTHDLSLTLLAVNNLDRLIKIARSKE